MSYKTATPATGESRGRAKLSKKRTGTTRDGSSGPGRKTSAAPTIGERVEYDCHVCGGSADATYKEWPRGSGWVEWQIGCHKSECRSLRDYLPTLAEGLGITEGASKEQIVAVLRLRGRPSSRRGHPEPLPSAAMFEGSARRLFTRDAEQSLAYLTEVRGLSREVIEAARIGWDGKRLLFPVFKNGELVAYKTRLPKAGAPMRKPKGSGAWDWPLYPNPQREAGRTFLVEGELDALRLRSVGVPATSVTGGVGQWRDEWAGELAGLRVVVAFDVEFEDRAAERADALQAAGVRARAFDLRTLGLASRNADLSDYLDGGGSVAKLRRVLFPRVVRRSS